MNPNIPTVISLVMTEVARQDQKWGDQHDNTPGKWSNILMEEVGEVAKAKLDEEFSTNSIGPSGVEVELVQVAAVAIQEVAALISRRKSKS